MHSSMPWALNIIPTNYHLLAAKHKQQKGGKKPNSMKNIWTFSGKNSGESATSRKMTRWKEKGLGRKTRQEIEVSRQGRHRSSLTSLPGKLAGCEMGRVWNGQGMKQPGWEIGRVWNRHGIHRQGWNKAGVKQVRYEMGWVWNRQGWNR